MKAMKKLLLICIVVIGITSCSSLNRVAPESYAKKLAVDASQCVEGSVVVTGKQQASGYTDYFLTTCKGPITVRHSGDDYRVIR